MPISKRNRRNLFLLLIILGAIIISPRVISSFYASPSPVISFQEFQAFDKQFELEQKKKTSYKRKKNKFKRLTSKKDPNTFLKKDWMRLGLSEKQTDIILRFSKRGLYSNDDLEKIFVFPDKLFQLIRDSLVYPERKTNDWEELETITENNISDELILVDINTADSTELKSIPGIGPFYAGKIIEHRNSLGGMIALEQLTEIWKFDNEKLLTIKKYIFLSNDVVRLNINKTSIEDLAKHPYISYKVANSIVKMREVNGNYSSVEGVLKSKLISQELFYKLEPYITIE